MLLLLFHSDDENSDWNDILKSSASGDDDDGFEKFLESSKQIKKRIDGDDKAENAAAKVKRKGPPAKRRGQKGGRPRQKVQSESDKLKKEGGDIKKRTRKKKFKTEPMEVQEEMLQKEDKMEVEMMTPRKPRFKRRSSVCDMEILDGFVEEGLDKEDVEMFKLAMARLRDLEEALVEDLPWAHYPSYILPYVERVCGGGEGWIEERGLWWWGKRGLVILDVWLF